MTDEERNAEAKQFIDSLTELPQAKRIALFRSSSRELIQLMKQVYNCVGIPKEDTTKWSPALAYDLKAVIDKMMELRQKRGYIEVKLD